MVAPEGSTQDAFLAGWRRAAAGAAIAVGVGIVLAEVVAFAFALAGGSHGSPGMIARAGWLLFYAFHHVPLIFEASVRQPGSARPEVLSLAVATAPMLATLGLVGVLFRVGRSNARRATARRGSDLGGPSGLAAGLEGAKVAPLYAALCGLGALAAHVTLIPTGSATTLLAGAFTVGPSVVASFLWPLVLAALAAFAGGMSAARAAAPVGTVRSRGFDAPIDDVDAVPAGGASRDRGTCAAVLGGGAIAGLGLFLAFGSLLVLAAVDNQDTRAYFDAAFGRGPARGTAAVGLTALEVPDMATWVLYPAMGSCIELRTTSGDATGDATGGGSTGRTTARTCVLSYGGLPSASLIARPADIARTIASGNAADRKVPSGYLLFALVPALAVVAGGWMAARRAGTDGTRASAAVGALAGIAFAAWSIPLVLLARTTIAIDGTGPLGGGGFSLALGPAIVLSVAVAAAWGVVGGAGGGALSAWTERRRTPPVRERVFPQAPADVEPR